MSTDALLILIVGGVLTAVTMVPLYLKQRRAERETDHAEAVAVRQGLNEPVSLHPVIDVESCIGTGNCIEACPEGNVFGIRDGQAVPISPARCIGHGLCERACPTEAIQLVLGTARRGVEVPRIRGNFETNVRGIYVVGELGGMGLIRNAFEQARRCIAGIANERSRGPRDALDVVIVGCGPAGLAASVYCVHNGLSYATIEKEDIGGTVRYYPRKKIVMTRPVTIPGYGRLRYREIRKEDLIAIWEDVVATTGIEVITGDTVTAVTSTQDGALLVTSQTGAYKTKRVILAIGRRGTPRKLHVPGEQLPKVIYSLLEPEVYRGDRALIVGGGDSAVEAALALAQQPGSRVTISYRRENFTRIKHANLERVQRAMARGKVDVLWSSHVLEIGQSTVRLACGQEAREIPNDLVAVFAGGELPTKFLERCGVVVETKFGTPVGC